MNRRARKWLLWEIGAAVAVIAVVAAVLVVVNRGGEQAAPAAPPTSTTPESPAPLTMPALAVKIDNVPEARPQTGLGTAAVVYVEPVEGGLTRLVAIYTGTPPPVIGPVRSARRTDLELLGQYGKPVLAYSGAAPELLPALRGANLVNAAPAQATGAYYRDRDRRAPHNLYLRTAQLPAGAGPAIAPLRFGPAPAGGVPTTGTERFGFRAAEFGFTWSATDARWLVAMNGTPVTTTDSGPVTAATVVCQRVIVTTSEPIEDAHGTVSPVGHTVGTGPAVVLRDGRRYTGA